MQSALPARPGVLHEHVRRHVLHLPHYVQLAKPVEPRRLVRDRLQLLLVRGMDLPDRVQPMVNQPEPLPADGGADAAAAVMADHEDVPHLDDVDGELQHREIIGVLRRRQVGDVAVDEHLARVQPDDLVGRHPAVRAADPEVFRRLLPQQPLEEIGIVGEPARRPVAVARLEVGQRIRRQGAARRRFWHAPFPDPRPAPARARQIRRASRPTQPGWCRSA